MQLRTYRGKSIADALTAVKRDLGPDALIVHTRAFKVGGVLGVGAREEVEILASRPAAPAITPSRAPAPTPRTSPASQTGRAVADRLAAAYHAAGPAPAAAPATPSPSFARTDAPRTDAPRPAPARPEPQLMQVRRRSAPGEQSTASPHKFPTVPAPVIAAAVEPAGKSAVSTPASPQLHDELGAIKTMVAQLLSSGARPGTIPHTPSSTPSNDPLADWYLRLLSNAVSRELADRIVADVRRRLPNPASHAGAPAAHEIAAAFRDCIAAYVPAAKESFSLLSGTAPRPRTVAVVGATGVGKTTTVAKLAAQVKLAQDARIAMITCDTNRIGAIEQLRTYADVLSLPFRVAATPDEMHTARAALADADLLLIDTPGLSPRDEHGIRALADLLDSADVSEVHLALPASGSQQSLVAACRAFAPLRPSRLLFTKLDEAVTYGVILSVAAEVKTELSYLTSGPRIPEQIEASSAERLAEMIAA